MGQIVFKATIENVSRLGVITRTGRNLIPNLHRRVIALVGNETADHRIGSEATFSFFSFSQSIPKTQTFVVTIALHQVFRKHGAHSRLVSNRGPERVKVALVNLPGKIE